MNARQTQFRDRLGRVLALFTILGTLLSPWPSAAVNPSPGTGAPSAPVPAGEKHAQVASGYGKLPLSFIQNDGQVDKKVKFYEKGSGHTTYFTKDGVYLSLVGGAGETPSPVSVINGPNDAAEQKPQKPGAQNPQAVLIKLMPLGANKNPKIVAEGVQEGKVNYFIGNDPTQWKTNVPTYQAVVYKDIYPGIDLKFYGNNQQLEYDIVVKPGADPSRVKLAYEGIQGLQVNENGDLELILVGGTILQKKPILFQDIDGKRVDVPGRFKIAPQTRHSETVSYGFEVAGFSKSHALVIDPVLVYSTYLGGSADHDRGVAIAADSTGNAYVTGYTTSTNFPTASALFGSHRPGSLFDTFVTKLSASGALVYSTYLGGSGTEFGWGVAVDSAGNAYVTGYTSSTDFPTASALYGSSSGTPDAYVAKLNASGNALIYSTYLGGSTSDTGLSIAVDRAGNAYVTGDTDSSDFPTAAALYGSYAGGSLDSFVTKLNASGSALVYSTYLGGSEHERGWGIAVDNEGNAYVAGYTVSDDFPTASALYGSRASGDRDGFVTKLDASGSAMIYSTYLGGSRSEEAYGIAVDNAGNTYVTGDTGSDDFPTAAALYGSYAGGSDLFVTKLNASGSAFIYSTYLGGSGSEFRGAIAADRAGNAYVTGLTTSTNFPTAAALSGSLSGGTDVFVTKLNASGSALSYSTYLGGSGLDSESGLGIAVDKAGNAYVTGETGSVDFPKVNPAQPVFGGGEHDAFVTKIAATAVFPLPAFGPATSFPGGDGPISVAIGDFNLDGQPDLVVANINGPGVSILLGTGTGTFGPPTSFDAGESTIYGLAIGDLNGDGKPDLALTGLLHSTVSILLGTGTGGFGPPTVIATNLNPENDPGGEPYSVAIGDLNGDGKLDLAVGNFDASDVSIFLGDGTGAFGAATNFSADGGRSVAVGDLNGDGKLDVAAANGEGSNTVSILLGTGTGAFSAATAVAVGENPTSVAIGDLDGDGKPDLAVANTNDNTVSILLGTGTGAFSAATAVAVGANPISVAIGDLDGDGKPDLAVANVSGGDGTTVSILLNHANNPPILKPIGPKLVNEYALLSFTIIGDDLDSDPLDFSATNLPPSASFNPSSQSFSWTPTSTQAGVYSVTFAVSDGSLTTSEVVSITVNDGLPVTSASPTSVTYGVTPSRSITIYGTGFALGSTITVGSLSGVTVAGSTASESLPFVFTSSRQVKFYWPTTSLPPGAYDVQVTNPGGASGTLSDGFTVAPPQPTINSISRPSVTYGITPSASVAIYGSNFVSGATISVDGVSGATVLGSTATAATPFIFVSSSQLRFYWANTAIPPGAHAVTVTNPATAGALSASLADAFTVLPPAPTVTSASPSSLIYDVSASQSVTIYGTNFISGATITVGGVTGPTVPGSTATAATPFVYVSSGQLKFYWNKTALLPGAYAVQVTNPAAAGGMSGGLAAGFTVAAAQPTITSVSPTPVTYGMTPSTSMTIYGDRFVLGATITVGTISGTTVAGSTASTTSRFVFVNRSQLKFYWPNTALPPGPYDVQVTNTPASGHLSATLANGLTVAAPQPTVTSTSPTPVTYGISPSASISIYGSNFIVGATITVGSLTGTTVAGSTATATTRFVHVNSSQLKFYWPRTALPPAAYAVQVTNPATAGGLSATLADGFTVAAPQPTVTSVSPTPVTFGTTSSGSITIYGSNFLVGAAITVGSLTGTTVAGSTATATTRFVHVNSSQVKFYWGNTSLPAGAYAVDVVNPLSAGGAAGSLANGFVVQ